MIVLRALERTEREETARFSSSRRPGGADGRVARALAMRETGIVDFRARRAITRTEARADGLAGRLIGRLVSPGPIYQLYDGASSSFGAFGHWSEPYPPWPSALPRKPQGLQFLDLLRPESVVEERLLDRANERDGFGGHYALRLDVDRIDWPEPPRDARPAQTDSPLARRAIRSLPDPRPRGVLSADVCIDEHGRITRFAWTPSAAKPLSRPDAQPWLATELSDFGGPPRIADHRAQPVIDPLTMRRPPGKAGSHTA